MTKTKLVVAGNGMTGLKFIEELLARKRDCFDITIVGEERDPAYNRILLSSLLSGEIEPSACQMRPEQWYRAAGISLLLGVRVTAIDTKAQSVTLSNGTALTYDVCVLATGSEPIRLNIPGAGLPGVHVFRSLGDADTLQGIASRGEKTVVIGGGLLGIEAAYGLRRSGADVTLVHLMDRLMERQLDPPAAKILLRSIEDLGIKVRLLHETAEFEGHGRVESVLFKSGERIAASAVVMAIGIRANAALAAGSRLKVNRGICVDDRMRTSNIKVFAIGECAEHMGTCYGLVEPCYEQAKVAAAVIAGCADAAFAPMAPTTNLKVSGVPVFSAGEIDETRLEHITLHHNSSGMYRKFVVDNDVLVGAVLIGDTTGAPWYRDLIRSRSDISHLRGTLPFGRFDREAA